MTPMLYVFIVILVVSMSAVVNADRNHQCEHITIPICMNIGYNNTRMPNFMGHLSQDDAAFGILEYLPLINHGCSHHLRFFLCSLYAPMCTEQVPDPIPSCREMCDEVRSDCAPVMERFGIPWPSVLNCSRLPQKHLRSLCMTAPNVSDSHVMTNSGSGLNENYDFYIPGANHPKSPADEQTEADVSEDVKCIKSERFHFMYHEHGNSCCPRCDRDVYFPDEDKEFAEIWMLVWSVLCFSMTLFTVMTFFLDTNRFQYPERPIIFLSMCCSMCSVAYILRLIAGRGNLACENDESVSFLLQIGMDSQIWCTIQFIVLYYFGMASYVWWVILTVTWFLAAGLKWGHEAIEASSVYFHLVAWVLPAVKTIIVLVTRRIDGDPLTAICYVGAQNPRSLLFFLLIPLICFLVIGVLFILAGFVSLVRIRRVMKHGGTNITKLEKLMLRIGVFSVLFCVPTTCLIACYLYEFTNMESWKETAMTTPCRHTETFIGTDTDCTMSRPIPSTEVFMVKIFMSLVIGLASSMWIWSSKTLVTWKNFICRVSPSKRSTVNNTQKQHEQCAITARPRPLAMPEKQSSPGPPAFAHLSYTAAAARYPVHHLKKLTIPQHSQSFV